jgi:hypothetical protein
MYFCRGSVPAAQVLLHHEGNNYEPGRIMNVGLYVHYGRNLFSLMACELGMALNRAGHDISIWSPLQPAPRQGPFDKSVSKKTYEQWLEGLDHVVFLSMPDAVIVGLAATGARPTSIVVSWTAVRSQHFPALRSAGNLLCPSRSVAQHCRRLQLNRNICCLPWSTDEPFLRSDHFTDPHCLGLFWHLAEHGPLARAGAANLLKELALRDGLYVTVAYDGYLGENAAMLLRRAQGLSDGRLEILANPDRARYLTSLARHDLFLSLFTHDDAALLCLGALGCGVACIAYDLPVTAELVRDGHNGRLVPCELTENGFGAPIGVVNDPAAAQVLDELLKDPETVTLLRQRTHLGLQERQEYFREELARLFPVD